MMKVEVELMDRSKGSIMIIAILSCILLSATCAWALSFSRSSCQNAPNQTLDLLPQQDRPTSWSIYADVCWIQVSPLSGCVLYKRYAIGCGYYETHPAQAII